MGGEKNGDQRRYPRLNPSGSEIADSKNIVQVKGGGSSNESRTDQLCNTY